MVASILLDSKEQSDSQHALTYTVHTDFESGIQIHMKDLQSHDNLRKAESKTTTPNKKLKLNLPQIAYKYRLHTA
jgi:hypothetical protein